MPPTSEHLLRTVIRELLRESVRSPVEDQLALALEKLAKFINDDPRMLSTHDAIEALNGTFYGIKVNGKVTDAMIAAELKRRKKLGFNLYPDDPDSRDELILRNATNIDSYVIPHLKKAVANINKRPKDAPTEGKTWGKWLFASYRNDVPLEKEDVAEERAYQAIRTMIYENEALPGGVAKMLQALVVRGEYLKLLSPTGYDAFYRGMRNIDVATINSLLGRDFTPEDLGEFIDVSTTFEPRGTGSSWSVNQKIASGYGAEASSKGKRTKERFSVVLCAAREQNPSTFILNPDTLYQIADFRGNQSFDMASAKEVYAVGSVKLERIKIWRG